jgi:hypothetical protein
VVKLVFLLSAIGIHSQAFDKKVAAKTILVLYPNIDKKSWTDECDKMDYHPNITYSTFASIEKARQSLIMS